VVPVLLASATAGSSPPSAATARSAAAGQPTPQWQWHLDPPPPGVDVHRFPSTSTLLAEAGLGRTATRDPLSTARDVPVTAGDLVPPGTPTTAGLTEHVQPSCSGTGADGDRVQVAYVSQVGGPDRYGAVLPALRSYVADVDDVMSMSSAETGGGRRVRWVTDANCVPVVLHVRLPAGSLGTAAAADGGFAATVRAMEAAGYTAPDRKYLMFVEADNLCGIAQVYPVSTPTGNANDGGSPMFARVDSACWTSSYHSVAAHELMHTLGSVEEDAPHHSAAMHCTDESDVMCYVDGAGVTLQHDCAAFHEQLYDCGHDDYFSTDPVAGSYLATHWNTADSSFLDVVPAPGDTPTLAVTAPATMRMGLPTTVSVSGVQPSSATTYTWTADPWSCLVGPRDEVSAAVMCPADITSPVTLSVVRVVDRVAQLGVATVAPEVAGPDALTVTASASPATVYAGSMSTIGGLVSWGGQAVRATVTVDEVPTAGGTWTRLWGPGLTGTGGAFHVATQVWVPTRYRVTVRLPAGSTWTAPQPMVTVNAPRRPDSLSIGVSHGRPDVVYAHLAAGTKPLAGQPLRLWVRYSPTAGWTLLLGRTTDSAGRTSAAVQPRRHAYYLWTYAGSRLYTPSRSPVVTVTY